jgi:hypothetical protein
MARAQSPLKPGAWELVTRVTSLPSNGAAENVMHEERSERCITPQFIATDPYMNPEKDNHKVGDGECRTSNYVRMETSATWLMICKVPNVGRVESAIRATVREREFQNEMTNAISRVDGSSQTVRLLTVGRYIGECRSQMKPLTP